LNMNGGASYSFVPGLSNLQKTESKNYTYSLGTVIASNVSQYVDFTVSYSANFNRAISKMPDYNKVMQETTQKFFSHSGSVQLNHVLNQYFLLTFNYNLRNFGKAATRTPNQNPNREGGFNRGNFQGNPNQGGNFNPGNFNQGNPRF